jgi:hypothetical protein
VVGIQTQINLFTVYGRVIIVALWGEVMTAISATATTLQYNWTSTTPSIAVQPLCAASASLSGQAAGVRINLVGGAVATAATITASAGISFFTGFGTAPFIVGTQTQSGVQGVSVIGELTGTANMTSGSLQFSLWYAPVDDGSYVSALM